LARSYIRNLLENDKEIKIVGECGDGKSAARFIAENKPDLVFLDIQMPEMDGFSLLKTLDAENLPAIIFTTAFEEYAIRAFEFHALDYLLKPFDAERFAQAIAFAKARLSNAEQQKQENLQIAELLKTADEKQKYLERLLIKQNGRIVFLKASEIDLIKADDKYVQIYAGKQAHLVRQTLSSMKSQFDPRIQGKSKRPPLSKTIVNFDEGKYPYPMDLLKVPVVKKRLRTLLGKKYDGFMEAIRVQQEPLEKKGDFIVGSGCADGLCTIYEAVFVIDAANNSIHCGIFHSGEKPKYRFYSETPKAMPAVLQSWTDDVIKRGK